MISHRSIVSLALAWIVALPVSADWPTSPDAPLVLGDTLWLATRRPHVAVTPDGASWIAWVDHECFSALRLQRVSPHGSMLLPGGVFLDVREDCLSREAVIDSCDDNTVLVCGPGGGLAGEHPTQVHRTPGDGSDLWSPDVIPVGDGAGLAAFRSLPGGDAVIAWYESNQLKLGRFAPDGTFLWPEPAVVPATFSNARVIDIVPDEAGNTFIIWDTPLTYTRATIMNFVSADGVVQWTSSQPVHPVIPGASRHTDPQAIADGVGGMLIVWTEGHETATTVAPLRMQRVGPDGSYAFPFDGALVTASVTRQFDVDLHRDQVTGDFIVAWRDGPVASPTLRAQRLALDGTREWGPDGVAVSTLGAGNASDFRGSWTGGHLALAVSHTTPPVGVAGVYLHRVNSDGNSAGAPWPLAPSEPSGGLDIQRLPGAHIVSWVRTGKSGNEIVAQRMNDDGTLGLPGLLGDLDGDGEVGFGDLVQLLAAWGPCGGGACPADLDDDGSVGFGDLVILLSNWG